MIIVFDKNMTLEEIEILLAIMKEEEEKGE